MRCGRALLEGRWNLGNDGERFVAVLLIELNLVSFVFVVVSFERLRLFVLPTSMVLL